LWSCAAVTSTFAAEIHVVAPSTGSDDGTGAADAPLTSILAAVDRAEPGDIVLVRAGVYRESIAIARGGRTDAPLTIAGVGPGDVVITGADEVPADKWQRSGDRGVWQLAEWTYRGTLGAKSLAFPDDERHRLIGRIEQVIVDGRLLPQVQSPDDLQPGSFCADPLETRTLSVMPPDGATLREHPVQVAVRDTLLVVKASHVRIRNLIFRYACNPAQQSAVILAGAHNVLEDCVVEQTNGVGAELRGRDNIMRRVVCRRNGQMGMSGFGVDNRLEQCELRDNNVKGFAKMWEAGGIKVVLSRRFRMLDCLAEGNDGPGFWLDIDNRDSEIARCAARANHGPGIMVEISETAHVHDNLCVENGLKDERGAWGHAGILLAEATRCTVEHNACVGNRTGIAIRQQEVRSIRADEEYDRPQEAKYYSHGHTIRQNISAFNREWQFALFGDNDFFAAEASAGVIRNAALLNPDGREWVVDRNVYFAGPGEGLVCWGAPWLPRHRRYDDLQTVQAEHMLEGRSLVADPRFRDWREGAFDLAEESPARELGAGIRSE
jgi:hypothetical protein